MGEGVEKGIFVDEGRAEKFLIHKERVANREDKCCSTLRRPQEEQESADCQQPADEHLNGGPHLRRRDQTARERALRMRDPVFLMVFDLVHQAHQNKKKRQACRAHENSRTIQFLPE